MKNDIEVFTTCRKIDYDPTQKLSKETRQAMLHVVLDLLSYYKHEEFVQYLEKSGRVEYVIGNLLSPDMTADVYADCTSSLRDWYGDWLCGNLKKGEEYYLPPPVKKKPKSKSKNVKRALFTAMRNY